MHTHNIPLSIKKKKIILNYFKYNNFRSYGLFPRDSRTSLNEPSVFEPLKFCCISNQFGTGTRRTEIKGFIKLVTLYN